MVHKCFDTKCFNVLIYTNVYVKIVNVNKMQRSVTMISGQNIVLTGCNSGIGLEVLKILVKGGNKILAVDKNINNIELFPSNCVIPMQTDVSTKEAVDAIFAKAEEELGFINIFYANAGYPYYEEYNYADWNRVAAMFETNVFSPIYSYSKYLQHLNGRNGIYAITVSAIGTMAMPGYTIYTSSKFAMHGFQQALRLEKPKNVQLTCLYPIATNTNFFKTANDKVDFKKPFPVQQPSVVARKMVDGIEKGKAEVCPSGLFSFAKQLMKFVPPVRDAYWAMEKCKFNEFKKNIANLGEQQVK